eukprot:515309_1
MAKDKAFQITLYAVFAFIVIIVLPMCIYAMYILTTNWNKTYFVKRRRTAILLMLILSCIGLFVSIPGVLIVNMIYDSPTLIPQHVLLPVLVPAKFSKFACTLLMIVRTWLYYFDINYNKEMSNKEWKAYLNECAISNYEWFTSKKHTLGCHIYCSVRALLLTTAIIIVYIIFNIKAGLSCDIYAITVYFILFVIAALVWHKYPKFNDTLGIRAELKRILIVWTLGIVSADIAWICGIYIYGTVKYDAFLLVAIGMMIVNLSAVVYFTIIDVYIRYKRDEQLPMNASYKLHVQSNSEQYKDVNIKSWKPIIQKIDGYQLFMTHLQAEFSIENLLFITEYAQLKMVMIELCADKMEKWIADLPLPWELKLPPSNKLPIPCITKHFRKHMDVNETVAIQENGKGNVFDKAVYSTFNELYGKYIKPGATFEVNVSSLRRANIMQLFENTQSLSESEAFKEQSLSETILIRFEMAVSDIEALMNDSFSRFRRTELAKEYWKRYVEDGK